MKKLLLILAVTIAANAGGIWDTLKNSSSDGIIKIKQYTIEVSGTTIQGHIFDVPTMKSICISTSLGKQSSHQLECKTYKEIEGN